LQKAGWFENMEPNLLKERVQRLRVSVRDLAKKAGL
jgi:hypothetical protein